MFEQRSKNANNVGIAPFVSMATEIRKLENCLEKATPVG